ncbi:MAG: DUF177 domain-containing protein [Pyrinomonadaceae bacterium]
MIIELESVGKSPRSIRVALDPGEIDLDGEAVRLAGEAILDGEMRRTADGIELIAVLRHEALLDCTRCLESVSKTFEVPFRDIFLEPAAFVPNTEAELSGDDLDKSIAESGRVDIADVMREQILLAVPEQILCRDDCKGLCPKCGADLNLIDCNCADGEVDPRWTALKNII